MNVEVEIFPWLSERLGGSDHLTRNLKWRVDIAAKSTVGDVMARLATEREGFRRFVFDPQSRTLSDDLVVVLNNRLLNLVGGLDAELSDGDRLAIIQALAGG